MKESNQFIPLPASYLKSLPAPTIKRRIALNLYEMLVLFGVLAFTFLVPHLIIGVLFEVTAPSAILMAHMYLVLAFYFMWYWTKTGQTLAMQTWRVRMIGRKGYNVTKRQAFWRYVYGSLWLIPCVVLHWAFHLEKWQIIEMLFTVALFIWPLSIYLDRRNILHRQSLPDRLAGSRLVELPKSLVTLR